MATSLKQWSSVLLVLFLFVGLRNVARAQGPTDKVLQCINDAAQEYADCAYSAPLWYAELCLLRYESDAILCVPEMILPK